MKRTGLLLALSLVVVITAAQKREQGKRENHPPTIGSFTSDINAVTHCPWPGSCGNGAKVANLTLVVTDVDGDNLKFECFSSTGKLSKCGRLMTWDLSKVANGVHNVRVSVRDGRGGQATAQVSVTVADCGACDRPPPPCPEIYISCPAEIQFSKLIKFGVKVVQAKKEKVTPTFYWTSSFGKITAGQGTSEIKVEPTDPEEEVRATVEVGSFDPSCKRIYSCTTKIRKR